MSRFSPDIPPAVIQSILAVFCFTYGAAVLGTHAGLYSPFTIGLIWYAAATIGALTILTIRKKLIPEFKLIRQHFRHSIPVLILGTGDGLFWFFSLLLLGLAGTAVAGRIGLVIMTFYSLFILKERYKRSDIFWMGVMLLASVLFAVGLDFTQEKIGYALAISGAICSAAFIISKKHTAHTIHGMALHMMRALIIWLVILVMYIFMSDHGPSEQPMTLKAAALIASGGMSNAVFGQFLRMKAFNTGGNLGTVTMVMATGPLLIFSYGFLILHEPGNIWKYTAAALMFTGVFALTWTNKSRKAFKQS